MTMEFNRLFAKPQEAKRTMSSDCIVVHISGAVYSGGDTIIFKMLQQFTGDLYLSVIVQCEEIFEDVYTFSWDKIPEDVRCVYEYVNSKSFIRNNILFGAHLGRRDKRTYALCNTNNSVGESKQISGSEICHAAPHFFRYFANQVSMKHVKC